MNATYRHITGGLMLVTALSISSAAMAQGLCPNGGEVAVVRLSKLKPSGSMAGFEKAVAAHARWYASHGYRQDRLVTAPVVAFDRKAKRNTVVKDQILTIHYNAQTVPQTKRDKAWDDYVALYKANSE